MFSYAMGLAVQYGANTLLLAGFVWLFWGGTKDGIFSREGVGQTLARCAGLVLAMQVVALGCLMLMGVSRSIMVALLSVAVFIAAWLFGLKFLFGKTFGEAFLATVVMVVGMLALHSAINAMFG